MKMCGSFLYPGSHLTKRIAQQIFDILPEAGLMMAIMDIDGNCWLNNPDRFSELNISGPFLRELCGKVDNGTEPLVTQLNDCSIVAAHLSTERANCGYVIIALPHYTPESTLVNIDLIEVLLHQASLIAELIEKNNLLHKFYSNSCDVLGHSAVPLH